MVLNQCVDVKFKEVNGRQQPSDIEYYFDFLDDFYVPYGNVREFIGHIVQHIPGCTGRTNSDSIELGDNRKWMQSDYDAEKHVLNLMVSIILIQLITVHKN